MNASAMAPVRSRARSYRATITAIAALALALVGCSSDDTKKAADASDTSAAGSSESSAKTTDSAAATNTKTVDYGVKPWTVISAPANCMCSDGSPYEFYVREANPKKVLFFLQGGGACFDAVSCAPGSTRFTTSIGAPAKALASTGKGEGIFDLANDENPFKDYSIVYAPYCTGDVHLGTKTNDYGNGVAVQHKGNINA
ncbi:MAG: pectin acetylesterase-family hydrolase, partial [Acidimicrobiia bacterium]